MGSVLLISTQPFNFGELAKLYAHLGKTYRRPSEPTDYWYPQLTIEGDWGWLRFDDYDPIEYEYYEVLADEGGPEQLAKVKALGDTPHFMVLEFSDREAGEMALLSFPDSGVTLVDNEDDMIFPIEETRRRIRAREEWEYTRNRRS